MDNINLYDLIKLFMIKNDEEDLQNTYYNYLDKIIDAISKIAYQKSKKNLDYYTINQLDEYIINYFENIDEKILNDSILKLSKRISYVTHKKDRVNYYKENLQAIYEYYKDGEIPRNITTPFYNKILNEQQDYQFHKKKTDMINDLMKRLPLTEKKLNNLKNGIRLSEGLYIIKSEEYDSLNIKEDDLLKDLEKIHQRLPLMEQFKKCTYNFTDNDFKYLDKLFMNNNLNDETLKEKYSFFSKRQIKAICNKYRQVLLPYIGNIEVDKQRIKLINVSYNSNHLKFYDFSTHYANVIDFITNLNYSEIDVIIDQYEEVKELFKLLPLVDLLPNFNIYNFKNIVLYYKKIKENLVERDNTFDCYSINDILSKFDKVMELANIYSKVDIYTFSILQDENIKKIVGDNVSYNVDEYIKTYINMLKRNKNTIPPISGEYKDYIYESGSADMERLFIGLNCFGSCIKPNAAGGEAYSKVLTKKDADVILIKDKNTKEFVSRALLFRKNNFIEIAPIYNRRGYENSKLYNYEFLSQIGNQLLFKSQLAGDNIEYVFLTNSDGKYKAMKEFPKYRSISLVKGFPHSDLDMSAYLIASTKKEEDISFSRKNILKQSIYYPSIREDIKIKQNNYQTDIMRIKSLEIITEADESKKEKLEEEFYKIKNYNFDRVYIGQDWYIAVKDNKILSKGIFDLFDIRQLQEINKTIENNHLELDKANISGQKILKKMNKVIRKHW